MSSPSQLSYPTDMRSDTEVSLDTTSTLVKQDFISVLSTFKCQVNGCANRCINIHGQQLWTDSSGKWLWPHLWPFTALYFSLDTKSVFALHDVWFGVLHLLAGLTVKSECVCKVCSIHPSIFYTRLIRRWGRGEAGAYCELCCFLFFFQMKLQSGVLKSEFAKNVAICASLIKSS